MVHLAHIPFNHIGVDAGSGSHTADHGHTCTDASHHHNHAPQADNNAAQQHNKLHDDSTLLSAISSPAITTETQQQLSNSLQEQNRIHNDFPKAPQANQSNFFENISNSIGKFTENFRTNNPALYEKAKYVRLNYPNWFSWATVITHAFGAMFPFIPFIPAKISGRVKQFAIELSRYGVPLAKLHNGLEALYGKRLFEAIARFCPISILPFLPFANFQLAYGLSSALNVTLECINDRNELKKEDGFQVNNQKVIKGFKDMVKDLLHNPNTDLKQRSKLFLTLSGAAAMLVGAVPGLLFARNSVDGPLAKIFGSIRSLGGLLGDTSIIAFSTKPTAAGRRKEQTVGSFFLIPTFMDFAQRWMKLSPESNEIFNHAKTSLNTIGELIWTHFSTEKNDKAQGVIQPSSQQSGLVSIFDPEALHATAA